MVWHKTSACVKCVKFAYYALNVLFWIVGVVILGIGVWLQLTRNEFAAVAPGYRFITPAALCMAAGGLTVFVGFLGCCGALVENLCMLTTYSFMAIPVICLELAAGSAAIVNYEQLEQEISQELHVSLSDRYPSPALSEQNKDGGRQGISRLRLGWDIIQSEFSCCGVDNYTDWYGSHGWPAEMRVPDSCCMQVVDGCGQSGNVSLWYPDGCIIVATRFLRTHLFTIGLVIVTFATLQVVAITMSVILVCSQRSGKYVHRSF